MARWHNASKLPEPQMYCFAVFLGGLLVFGQRIPVLEPADSGVRFLRMRDNLERGVLGDVAALVEGQKIEAQNSGIARGVPVDHASSISQLGGPGRRDPKAQHALVADLLELSRRPDLSRARCWRENE